MTRREFLKFLGSFALGFLIGGCSNNIPNNESNLNQTDSNPISTNKINNPSATPTETPTPEPTPIPTLSPEVVGGIKDIPDPRITNPELFDLKKPDAPISQFVNALRDAGIEVTEEEVVNQLHPQLETPEGLSPFITYRTSDGVALIIATQNPETKEWKWEKATLRNLSEYILPFSIGTTASGGDKPTYGYDDALRTHFSVVSFAGPYSPSTTSQPKRHEWLNKAKKNGQQVIVKEVLNHKDLPDSLRDFKNEDASTLKMKVENYMQERIDMILSDLISKNMLGKATICLANEPFETGTWVTGKKSPFYKAFGGEWITESYLILHQKAQEKGITLGKDIQVVLLNEREIEKPGKQTDFVIKEINIIKQSIVKRLGISVEELPQLGIGIQYHLGKTQGERNETLSFEWLINNEVVLSQHLENISQQTGNSFLYLSEIDFIGTPEQEAKAYTSLLRAAISSKKVKYFIFFHALASDRLNSDSEWQNRLLGDQYKPSIVYYELLRAILEYK